MKKFMIAGVVALVVIASLGVAGYAYAQTQTPLPTTPYGPGMMGGRGGMMGQHGGMMGGRGGMMGGQWDGEYGPLHEYMFPAIAEAFDLTPEELQARLDKGDTCWTIAQEKGLTEEQFFTLMKETRTQALQQAVEAGAITQEQADWMLQRMEQMGGFGSCHGGVGGARRGPGRWNAQPTQQPAQPNS